MRPDAVPADVAHHTLSDIKIASPFFQQDSTGGVITAVPVSRSAILHADPLDSDAPRTAHQNGKTRYVDEPHIRNRDHIGVERQNTVARREPGKWRAEAGQTAGAFERAPVAVNRKPGEADAP